MRADRIRKLIDNDLPNILFFQLLNEDLLSFLVLKDGKLNIFWF